jgi:hypothetical protein
MSILNGQSISAKIVSTFLLLAMMCPAARAQDTIVTGNPIIKDKITADPTAFVHCDSVYLYTRHDEAPAGKEGYVMHEWLCYSSSDMRNWEEHPVPLNVLL